MTDKIVVLNTCASAEEAEKIAHRLIEARLAACVNVLPGARSYYRWQGAIENAVEWLLIIKTSRERFEDLSSVVFGDCDQLVDSICRGQTGSATVS